MTSLDYQLPDGTGLDVARGLRARHPSPPMVMLTARGGSVPMSESISAGVSEFMEKPVDADKILNVIEAGIGRP
ncbi:MAG: response regulator [Deltaproteobacteria bacterium]